jgi:hypothetical protein
MKYPDVAKLFPKELLDRYKKRAADQADEEKFFGWDNNWFYEDCVELAEEMIWESGKRLSTYKKQCWLRDRLAVLFFYWVD